VLVCRPNPLVFWLSSEFSCGTGPQPAGPAGRPDPAGAGPAGRRADGFL